MASRCSLSKMIRRLSHASLISASPVVGPISGGARISVTLPRSSPPALFTDALAPRFCPATSNPASSTLTIMGNHVRLSVPAGILRMDGNPSQYLSTVRLMDKLGTPLNRDFSVPFSSTTGLIGPHQDQVTVESGPTEGSGEESSSSTVAQSQLSDEEDDPIIRAPPEQIRSQIDELEDHQQPPKVPEVGGPRGPEPTRYGDWEKGGRCYDF